MQEHECYPNNTFSDSVPDIDIGCGCIEDYDLTEWNDTEPIDDENGSFNPMPDERPHGAPCLVDCPENPDCPDCPDYPNCNDCPDCPTCPERPCEYCDLPCLGDELEDEVKQDGAEATKTTYKIIDLE